MEPTHHAEHETIEITQGINNWSEVGFYIFTSERDGQGVQWVGDHIRPRVRVPDAWHWPVGVSLSTEIGYQRARYAPDTWDWEIRPIVDKQTGRWYFAVNPALERAWHGPDVKLGIDFSPAVKISYDFTKKIAGGLEYYADYGSVTSIASFHDQQQQFFPAIDLNVSPDWEINFGVGIASKIALCHRFKGFDALLANRQSVHQISPHLIAAARSIGNSDLARRGDRNFRLNDVFFPIAGGSGYIAGQSEVLQCRQRDIVRAADAGLQHSAAPNGYPARLGRVVNRDGL
jgi:hypothetical protein